MLIKTVTGVTAILLASAPAAIANPQNVVINAGFLATSPAPPVEAAVCVVDTGVTPVGELGGGRIIRSVGVFAPGDHGEDVGGLTANGAVSEHGTPVASVAARLWPHLKIVSVRISPAEGWPMNASAYPNAIVDETKFCGEPRVKVINLSFGSPPGYSGSQASLRTAEAIARVIGARGINVVAAAGNSGLGQCGDPGYTPLPSGGFAAETVCVGAVNAAGERCTFSNFGAGVDLYGGGCNATATGRTGAQLSYAGTSFAAPAVAAVLAALRAYRPDLRAVDAEALLKSTAVMPAGAPGPVVDAAAAFRAAGLGHLVEPPQAAAPPAAAGAVSDPGSEPSTWTTPACLPEGQRLRSPSGVARLRGRKLTLALTCAPERARMRLEFRAPGRREFATRRVAVRTVTPRNNIVTVTAPRRWTIARVRYVLGSRGARTAELLASPARGRKGTPLASVS
jgi:hypothetical protein